MTHGRREKAPASREPGEPRARGRLSAEAYWQLMYLGLMGFDPLFRRASTLDWAMTLGGVAIFLPLYFRAWRTPGRAKLIWISAIALLGVAVAPFNFGSFGYHIYAAALLAHNFRPRIAIQGLTLLLGLILTQSWLLDLPEFFWIFGGAFVVIVGVGNIYYGEKTRQNARLRRTQEEVERLAKTAERERIARDLHDLLGHTLSLVTLKAELAARLASREPERAGREMREVERIAREALSEVRATVTGYRAADLATARIQAELALEAAGVHLEWREDWNGHPETPELPAQEEHVLALALREAVTNVVRHARALTCRVDLTWDGDRVELQVADDGKSDLASPQGLGLSGMRERVEALDGTIELRRDGATTLRVVLPVSVEMPTASKPAPRGAPRETAT